MFSETSLTKEPHAFGTSESHQIYDVTSPATSSTLPAPIITTSHGREDTISEKADGTGAVNDTVTLSRVPSEPPFTIFSRNTRIFIVFMVAVSALISPFAATLYYPALNPLAQELHVSSSLINLSITTFMVE
jgi:hypothetical protein